MRRRGPFIALLGFAFALAFEGAAWGASASMSLTPAQGAGDEPFTATYRLSQTAEEGGCPTGAPITFTWQSTRATTPLGSAALGQDGAACLTRLLTAPPTADRGVGSYTVCGTYTRPDESTVVACEDYTIDAPAESSPGASPGATGGPGASPGDGGTGGTPGATPGATEHPSPGETGGTVEPSPHKTGEAEAAPPLEGVGGSSTAAYVGLGLILVVAVLAMRDAGSGGH